MGVRLIWYGCPPASMGVSTPTVEYNSPPMRINLSFVPVPSHSFVSHEILLTLAHTRIFFGHI